MYIYKTRRTNRQAVVGGGGERGRGGRAYSFVVWLAIKESRD